MQGTFPGLRQEVGLRSVSVWSGAPRGLGKDGGAFAGQGWVPALGASAASCLSAATIEKEMRKLFDIPAERETRLWNKYMSNTYEQLSKLDNTVQDAGLYQGQVGGQAAQRAAQPGAGAVPGAFGSEHGRREGFAHPTRGSPFLPGASH